MKLEQAVLSNACHESEFFSLQYYYEYYPKFSLNRSTTYTHTRVHTRIRTEYLFNSFQLCFIIIVHSCTCMYRREETNAFEILSTLNKTLFEFVVSNSSMFDDAIVRIDHFQFPRHLLGRNFRFTFLQDHRNREIDSIVVSLRGF